MGNLYPSGHVSLYNFTREHKGVDLCPLRDRGATSDRGRN